MKEVARFHIDDKFTITGRGIIFTGHILKGVITIGNYIEFKFQNELIKRKITGIEAGRHSIQNEGVFDKKNTGLLIGCQSENEIKLIKASSLKEVEVLIFEK